MRVCYPVILLMTLLGLSYEPALCQDEESYLDVFQRTLMESFLGPLRAEGVEVTPAQRAVFMGYILKRQDSHIGSFEIDLLRQERLVAEVRGFLAEISPDQDLWPYVVAARSGEYKEKVDRMLGGSPYVAPIFTSLKSVTRQWRDLEYGYDRFQNHPRKQEALRTAQDFLLALRALDYEEAMSHLGGRFKDEFGEWLAEIQANPELKTRTEEWLADMEWMGGMNELAATDPPFARILHTISLDDPAWEEHWCYLILDNGTWKIVRFFFERLAMIHRTLLVVGLALAVASTGLAEELSEDQLYQEFLEYTMETYLKVAGRDDLGFADFHLFFADYNKSSRILGYSLANLLKFARRGDVNHEIWLILESRLKQDIEETLEAEGAIRGWTRDYIDKKKKREWQECMGAQQGWYDAMLIVDTRVTPKDAPDFFATLGGVEVLTDSVESPVTGVQTPGSGDNGDLPDPFDQDQVITESDADPETDPATDIISDTYHGTVSDEILGLWTYTNETERSHQPVHQKLVIQIRGAGKEEVQTAYGPRPQYLYEGYVLEIENITDERSNPQAAVGELLWKLEYFDSGEEPSEKRLNFTLDHIKDRYGPLEIRLMRHEGVLEVGRATYYRGGGR